MANIVLSMFTLLLAMKGSVSVNVLESTPPSVGGVLTACAGQQISLTCSHNNTAVGNTRWTANSPLNCLTSVNHDGMVPLTAPPCGPFTFRDITPLLVDSTLLSSTAVANTTVNMDNVTIECRGGNVQNFISVGSITLCIVAPPPPLTSLTCEMTSSGLNVTWEPVIDTSCGIYDVNYLVTAIRESDMMTIISSMLVTETTAELTLTLGLQFATSYIISVSAVTINGSCESQQATVKCETCACLLSNSLLTTTDKGIINEDSTSVSTVLAISNIVIGVSTLFIGVIIGVTVTYCITRNSSSQHEQRVSTNVSSDGPMYEETTTTNMSNERFKMDKNDAYGPIR